MANYITPALNGTPLQAAVARVQIGAIPQVATAQLLVANWAQLPPNVQNILGNHLAWHIRFAGITKYRNQLLGVKLANGVWRVLRQA